jgi:hypothetical protein
MTQGRNWCLTCYRGKDHADSVLGDSGNDIITGRKKNVRARAPSVLANLSARCVTASFFSPEVSTQL